MAQRVAGELYESITGQLFELGRQLRQPTGYPFNPVRLKQGLQDLIEGRFASGKIYNVKLGGPEMTDQIVVALRENGLWVNEYVTQENFPLTPHAEEEAEIEIIDPGCSFSEEEGLEFLKEAGLVRPTYEHALRFAEQQGMATISTNKPFVIFLHEAWLGPDDNRRVLCIYRDPENRELSLCYPDRRFSDSCVLAGVRPRK